ncbi:class I SAM-dependent methyltransferase [Rudaeicoccus suwonensis]|uniref:class I SAM-dependent methyltransferase n=1 Tax=Rudaeicoccus suwonensis TaxID=657409 RepID=UPI001FE80888|nr:class I SAM-dependent methyltransferase [Rudaeicoccus suwonensis]
MCEICAGRLRDRHVRGGATLQECSGCGHLLRSLACAPAGHRDHAYGGEPTLDRWRLALTYRLLRRHSSPASVFEVGFGTGALLRRFLDDGASVAGADPDQLGLSVDPRVRAVGDLHACAVEDVADQAVSADLVYGIHVLEHVRDPTRTLQFAARLLRPGGSVQFLTPAGDSDGLRLYGAAWWMLEDPTHVRFFTARSLTLAAEAAGLVDIRVERPALDSTSTDAASLVRLVRPAQRPGGVLSSAPAVVSSMATTPLVLAARAVAPRLRPTLHLIARRPH